MAALGRWTATDPILHRNPARLLKNTPRLLTVSSYDYVLGNPVGLTDPTGNAPCCTWLGPAIWTKKARQTIAKGLYEAAGLVGDMVGATPGVANAPATDSPTSGRSRSWNELSTDEQITVGVTADLDLLGGRGSGKAAGEAMEGLAKYTDQIGGALKEAVEGGKEAGVVKNYMNRPLGEIKNSIKSHKETISEHQDAISNPSGKVDDFQQLHPNHQQDLIENK